MYIVRKNVLLSTGRQMYIGKLDNRNVFRSDKTVTNVMYLMLQGADMASLAVSTSESLSQLKYISHMSWEYSLEN